MRPEPARQAFAVAALRLSGLFAVVLYGADALAARRETRLSVHFAWELEIPYWPAAFVVHLSMPTGTDARVVRQAAREFAKGEQANNRYVMVLHTHQANPHVHISVRAEGREGERLNPRKEDLHRWRETFAEKLRDWGIEAEASPQATRGVSRRSRRGWERPPRAHH